jgi:hypothetical protein
MRVSMADENFNPALNNGVTKVSKWGVCTRPLFRIPSATAMSVTGTYEYG